MRTNSYSELYYTYSHKKNRGQRARNLLSKGWWKLWDRKLPEILKYGFMSKFVLDLISIRNRASEFFLWWYCNLNLHISSMFSLGFKQKFV